jgi:hypothetical protein
VTCNVGRIERVVRGVVGMPATCSPEELMTVVPGVSQAVGGSGGQLLTVLQEIHGPWLREIRKLLDSARRPEAGIHCRWRAVRYLNTIVSPRFEIERAGVETLGQMVEPRHAAQLWLAAELMASLDWQVDHELALCHRAGEFSLLTHKFEKAMVHWCRAVEDTLGELSWGEIPEQARQRFAVLRVKEVRHDV